MEPRQVPGEIAHTMQLTKDRKTYLPILYIDELSMRQRELVKVNSTDEVGTPPIFIMNSEKNATHRWGR